MSDNKPAACKFISSKTIVVPKPGKFPDVDNAPIKSDTSGTDNIEDQKYQKDAAAADLMKKALQLGGLSSGQTHGLIGAGGGALLGGGLGYLAADEEDKEKALLAGGIAGAGIGGGGGYLHGEQEKLKNLAARHEELLTRPGVVPGLQESDMPAYQDWMGSDVPLATPYGDAAKIAALEEKETQILVPSLRGLKQAAWYDYLNPVNYVLPGGPSQVGAERDRGNKLDAERAKQQKAKMPKKPAAKASVENVNRQIDKGGLTAGSYRN